MSGKDQTEYGSHAQGPDDDPPRNSISAIADLLNKNTSQPPPVNRAGVSKNRRSPGRGESRDLSQQQAQKVLNPTRVTTLGSNQQSLLKQ